MGEVAARWGLPTAESGREVTWSSSVVGGRALRSVGLGLRFRKAVPGPEQRLVDEFLESQVFQVPRGCRLTVFAQPALATGFPDIVAVVWRKSRAKAWPEERQELRAQDVRLIHVLHALGWTELAFLQKVFPTGLDASLRRLEAAELLVRRRHKCRARPAHRIFAVEMLVSVEAKVAPGSRLLEQAAQNAWFSSESYALLPSGCTMNRAVRQATGMGVGVLSHGESSTKLLATSQRRDVPASYGSWLFNEWVWRLDSEGHLNQRVGGDHP